MSYALRRVSVAAFGAVAEAAQAAGKQTGRRGVASSARRNGGAEKPFWSEGTQEGPQPGYLFGESPPPPGQARKWESWELPWCVGSARTARHEPPPSPPLTRTRNQTP